MERSFTVSDLRSLFDFDEKLYVIIDNYSPHRKKFSIGVKRTRTCFSSYECFMAQQDRMSFHSSKEAGILTTQAIKSLRVLLGSI